MIYQLLIIVWYFFSILWQNPWYSLTEWEVESENTFETVRKHRQAHREWPRLPGIAPKSPTYLIVHFRHHFLFFVDSLLLLWQAINNGRHLGFRSKESMYALYEPSRGDAGSQSSMKTHSGVVELHNTWIWFFFDRITNFLWQVDCTVHETIQNRFIQPCRCKESSVAIWELLECSLTHRVSPPAVFCQNLFLWQDPTFSRK